jgi:hypothetical protein
MTGALAGVDENGLPALCPGECVADLEALAGKEFRSRACEKGFQYNRSRAVAIRAPSRFARPPYQQLNTESEI